MNRSLLFLQLLMAFSGLSQTPYIQGKTALCHSKPMCMILHGDSIHNWVNAENPTIILSTDSLYCFSLEVSTSFLCYTSTDTLEHHIEVFDNGCNCLFFVPNQFTPDGDPFNETFFPVINCDHIGTRMTIYARNQSVVYDSSELYPVWDGTHYDTGEPLQDDIYIWQISYMKEDGEVVHEIGWVFLTR